MRILSAIGHAWFGFCVAVLATSGAFGQPPAANRTAGERPNILWISLEDISPDFGCYGDRYAVTPVFDRFAESGVRYTRVFTHAPVCAPSRSGLITGMYPTSIATHHMRCKGVPPPEVKCFTEYLRAAGYYCTNNAKTDYQFDPPFTAWDENGHRGHWRGRQVDQPFFAVFNFTNTHESQVRAPSAQTKALVKRLTVDERHDPAKAILPPYYPDTPAVRRDWANYHDNITAVQTLVAQLLAQLEEDGLADDTIVWIWGDHGRGLPRGKRWVYDSGIHAPLLVRVPEKWRGHAGGRRADQLRPGSVNDDLVAFVDFGPAVLSLAGVEVPRHMQGRPFLGPQTAKPRDYVFAARDRMDERYDVIRAVRDKRFKYIRNFMPHLPYAQRIAYMELMPIMREWRRLDAAGQLSGAAALFFRETKPIEELYDTQTDPHEVHNLAADTRYADKLKELRGRLTEWMIETHDLGLIPEPILDEAQRPGARWATTEPPAVKVAAQSSNDGGFVLRLSSGTAGASIAYQLKGGGGAWKLYHGMIGVEGRETLVAKACRIGYRDSPIIEFSPVRRPQGAPADVKPSGGEDWRPQVIIKEVLTRLLALKEHDRDRTKAVDAYERSLADEHPAMRYWAITGLRIATRDKPLTHQIKAAVTKLAEQDESEAVRMVAAHALCRWGEQDAGLPILAAGLESRQPAVQLHAAHALENLGETARPLLPRLKQLAAKSSEYVQRVTSHTMEQLEARDR
ncbi:MAG: sulfatase-like hydrolase/transferase [Pirellulales bacterium]